MTANLELMAERLEAGLSGLPESTESGEQGTADTLAPPEAVPESDEQIIARLAALPALQYDRLRISVPRIQLLTPGELQNLPPLKWLVRGVLPDSGLGAIFGPSGGGKSFLVLDLLGAIAAGREWFSHAVTAAPCIYCVLEGEAGVGGRVQAYMARHGSLDGLRVIVTPFDVRESAHRRALIAAVRDAGMAGGVLVLDTLNRAAPGLDENDGRDMGLIIEAMKALQRELGGLVLAVHHSGKDASRGLRGHSSLLAALDVVVEVSRQETRREWRTVKSKDGADGESHPFTLEVTELGEDSEGWPVTSCVVRPEETASESVRKASPPGGGNQRIAWDVVGELLKASRRFGEGKAPPVRPCVRLGEALDAIAPHLPTDPKRQRERAQQAVTGLIGRGCLEHFEGWLWIP